jgi:WD40 repeat protein
MLLKVVICSCSTAHHDTVKRIKFNPNEKLQLTSGGMDGVLKVYEIAPSV